MWKDLFFKNHSRNCWTEHAGADRRVRIPARLLPTIPLHLARKQFRRDPYMSVLIIRFAVAVAAIFGGFASSFLWSHADALAYRATDSVVAVFVAAVLAGKMLIPVVTAWLPFFCTGAASVGIAVLASWPGRFGRPLDEWIARGRRDVVGHVFGLLFTAAAMAITTLIFLMPPTGLAA